MQLSDDTIRLLDNISGLSAYMSISFWLFAQLPQVIKNRTDKSVDGFSLGFLVCWFAGDLLNLVSCLLNDAMMFQILLSSYYCLIDVILASQYYYYKYMYHNPESRWHHRTHRRRPMNSPRTSLRDNLVNYGSIDSQLSGSAVSSNDNIGKPRVQRMFKNRNTGLTGFIASTMLTGVTKVEGMPIKVVDIVDGKENNSAIYQLLQLLTIIFSTQSMGKTLAWSCTTLYLFSRVPQIHTNYTLKTTRGVSLKLICFALCGNFFYSMSLLLCRSSTIGGDISRDFWTAEISYFIGALGTVFFDLSVIVQWYFYDYKTRVYTKSGRLRARTPKTGHLSGLTPKTPVSKMHSKSPPQGPPKPKMIDHPIMHKISDPIEMSESVKSTLSPNHMKKINEFTPLSPMDFLLDSYVPTNAGTNAGTSYTPSYTRGYIPDTHPPP